MNHRTSINRNFVGRDVQVGPTAATMTASPLKKMSGEPLVRVRTRTGNQRPQEIKIICSCLFTELISAISEKTEQSIVMVVIPRVFSSRHCDWTSQSEPPQS